MEAAEKSYAMPLWTMGRKEKAFVQGLQSHISQKLLPGGLTSPNPGLYLHECLELTAKQACRACSRETPGQSKSYGVCASDKAVSLTHA